MLRQADSGSFSWRGWARLMLLPWQRFPVAMLALGALLLLVWGLALIYGGSRVVLGALAVHGYACLFVAMMSAMVWSSVCRAETRLLPGFRRSLAWVWIVYLLLLVWLPSAYASAHGVPPLSVMAALWLVLAVSFASGSGAKWAAAVWMLPLVFAVWPDLGRIALASLRTGLALPLAMLLLAIAVMMLVWRRLLQVNDSAPTLSPADVSMTDPRTGPEALQASQSGAVATWIRNLQQRATAIAFDRVLRRLAAGHGASAERALGLVLMPNLHLRGLVMEMLLLLAVVLPLAWYFSTRASTLPSVAIAAYIGLLSAMRFQQLHRATVLMRPSLCDLYLAMAPPSGADFTRVVALALRPALIGAFLFALVLSLATAWILPAAQQLPYVAGVALGSIASGLVGYGVVLMLLDAPRPRLVAGALVLAFFGSNFSVLVTAAMLQSWAAGALAAGLCLTFGYGFARAGLEQAQRDPLRFDPVM